MKRIVCIVLTLILAFSMMADCLAATADEGSKETTYVNIPRVTLEVPMTDEDDPETAVDETTNTKQGSPAGYTYITGDYKTSDDDPEYDYTIHTTLKQWRASVTTEQLSRTIRIQEGGSDLTHLKSEIAPTADNNLLIMANTHAVAPAEGEALPEAADGYRYVYIGSDYSPQFWATYLFKSRDPDVQPGDVNYEDTYIYKDPVTGQEYFFHASHKNSINRYGVEGLYLRGELVEPVDKQYLAFYSSILHFIMVDTKTGKSATTYCADLDTNAEQGFSYNLKSLEDAHHYSPEQADMIRTVALNGYWGIEDDPATPTPDVGSLAAMRAMMRAASKNGQPVFSQEEIALLDEGVASTVTQFAIWNFSNVMNDMVFVNVHYISKNDEFVNNQRNTTLGNVPAALRPKVDLIFKLFEYMIHMPPTKIEIPTAENTVIHEENFLKEISFKIRGKNFNLDQNRDNDAANDVYQIDLSFSLGVEPSETLFIEVFDEDDVTGKPLARGRFAGTPVGDEILLTKENGFYTFSDLAFGEGTESLVLRMTGTQELDQGVYLYLSEEKEGVTSQTMVGVAEGERSVDVSMKATLDFSADDETVSDRRMWRKTVPPMDVPETGDASGVWGMLFLASAVGIALLHLSRKRAAR